MRRHHTFLFTLNTRVVVDGAIGGNASIYINHSCEPNCEAIITGNRIYIHALRTILPGEEIVYDYQYERTGDNDEEMEKFYACRCGTASCRGTIMQPPKRKRSRVANVRKKARGTKTRTKVRTKTGATRTKRSAQKRRATR
jgi:hypothetical protein